ncbi:S100P-binding protein-like isoform X2 [Clinocottus analis]|uniref:S100P-binding protein-like isoform X2 n=1 Tax=Clinocottus analis TaxID=304258 RepID=UPI0035C18A4D
MKRMLCEQEANLQQREFTNPFINFKFEYKNNGSKKRPHQDSNSDDGYATPAKKACSSKALSPDLGCFMDYWSPPVSEDSVSPLASSLPALLDKTQTINSAIKKRAGSPLHLEDVARGSSTEPGIKKESVTHSLGSEKVLLNLAPAFDCDVENSLCLNPYEDIESRESHSTFLSNLSLIVGGPVLESHNSDVEPLEGDAEEAWDIGTPIFESSIFHSTFVGEEDTLYTSFETTLPLQVKVKSVVVDPNKQTSSSKTAAPPLIKHTEQSTGDNRDSRSVMSQRPEVFKSERDWNDKKHLYVHSVTRHMKEHQGENPGVMTELQNLMNNVANQRPGTHGKRWQHPSDLTRRNYQRRFGNGVPKLTLGEWQSQNNPAYKRFAKVPPIFQRCPLP